MPFASKILSTMKSTVSKPLTWIFYREAGIRGSGGYYVKRSFWKFLTRVIWEFRLSQALQIANSKGQPQVIGKLHDALREHEPQYLRDWRNSMVSVGNGVDDLVDVMEWLREGKHYAEADRLRTIIGQLARSVPDYRIERDAGKFIYLIRDIARTYK